MREDKKSSFFNSKIKFIKEMIHITTEFWVGLIIQLVSTVAGIGVMYGTIKTRLNYLEKKLDKHNNVVERMYKAETDIAVLQKENKVADHRIADLEEKESEN